VRFLAYSKIIKCGNTKK